LVQKENELLKSESKINSLKKQRLWWLIAGLICLGLVIVLWQFQSYGKNKKIQEEKALRQEAEIDIQKKEKDQLERELASQALQLCQKNDLLTSVKSQVSNLLSFSSENTAQLQHLEKDLKLNLQNEESWSQFLLSFEKVHPEYLKNLQDKGEKLSQSEQRLVCLLKMNLTSKQVATILNITPDGIKKARYRLRKKLNLESEVNLVEYLSKV